MRTCRTGKFKNLARNLLFTLQQSECQAHFSLSRHADKKLEPWVLELQTGGLRDKINIDSDAGHTSRSTFLAEAAECADVFAPEHCWPRHHQDDDVGRSQPDVLPDQSGREAGRGRHKCRRKVCIKDRVQLT